MPITFHLRIPREFMAKISAAVLVFILSIIIMPFYISGDQTVYRRIYAGLSDYSLIKGFLFYKNSINSTEFVHFILSWVASQFVSKDLFIAFSNAILAYVAVLLFMRWKASVIIALVLVLSNFYLLVLYFASERLKYGIIFVVLSIININNIKRFYGFMALALISHISVLIIYASTFFNILVKRVLKLFYTGKVSRTELVAIPFLFIPLLLVKNQIISKFLIYYNGGKLLEVGRILVYLFLALLYSKKRSETIIFFMPIIISAFLLGGFRVNIFGYFLFLYYGLQFKRGWNVGILATSIYFAYSSAIFLINIIQHGDGFFPGLDISMIGLFLR